MVSIMSCENHTVCYVHVRIIQYAFTYHVRIKQYDQASWFRLLGKSPHIVVSNAPLLQCGLRTGFEGARERVFALEIKLRDETRRRHACRYTSWAQANTARGTSEYTPIHTETCPWGRKRIRRAALLNTRLFIQIYVLGGASEYGARHF